MKAEADLHFLQGINQLIGHGWPYSPPLEQEPGWRMYAAAALNAHNPWFFAMPDLTRYLQRVSFALRQGEPANDVAVLLPNDDVWATFKAGVQKRASPTSAAGFDESGSNVSVDENMDKVLGKQVIAQVLDAGFNLDFIDADAIDSVGVPYKVLILPAVDRIPASTYEKILAFAQHGGIVIATQRLPAMAPGFIEAQAQSARIEEISNKLFDGAISTAHFIADESQLSLALLRYAEPDMALTPRTPEIGFIHRKLASGDLYFVANTSNQEKHVQARFRSAAVHVETWDAFTGEFSGLPDPRNVSLDLAPYESRLSLFPEMQLLPPRPGRQQQIPYALVFRNIGMSHWSIGLPLNMESLDSWTDNPQTRFFPAAPLMREVSSLPYQRLERDKYFSRFRCRQAVPLPSPPGKNNMRAYLDPPLREAAEVYVNGQRATWSGSHLFGQCQPISPRRRERSEIIVGNTAINSLAGQTPPDYRLLWAAMECVLFLRICRTSSVTIGHPGSGYPG